MRSAAGQFTEHRDMLFTVAYEILGSADDAEDVLQESWLRWSEVDHVAIENPRAYLARTVARQALNRLRSARRQREAYAGQWLPEPVATHPGIEEDLELAESVSLAMLIVLESLEPVDRAVFVLREVFDFSHNDIAHAVGKSPHAVRQIAHRARTRVHQRRGSVQVTSAEHAEVSSRFFHAVAEGDIQQLMDVLSPNVVLMADGGGSHRAVLLPIRGRDKVLRFMRGVRPPNEQLKFESSMVNGATSLLIHLNGALDAVVGTRVEDGRITEIYVMRNLPKLKYASAAVSLAR